MELAESLPHAHTAEATALVQGQAGCVLGEDTRLNRPDSEGVGFQEEGFEEPPAHTLPLMWAVDVDAHLDNARVCAPF